MLPILNSAREREGERERRKEYCNGGCAPAEREKGRGDRAGEKERGRDKMFASRWWWVQRSTPSSAPYIFLSFCLAPERTYAASYMQYRYTYVCVRAVTSNGSFLIPPRAIFLYARARWEIHCLFFSSPLVSFSSSFLFRTFFFRGAEVEGREPNVGMNVNKREQILCVCFACQNFNDTARARVISFSFFRALRGKSSL